MHGFVQASEIRVPFEILNAPNFLDATHLNSSESDKFVEAHSLRVKSTAEAMEAPQRAKSSGRSSLLLALHKDACRIMPLSVAWLVLKLSNRARPCIWWTFRCKVHLRQLFLAIGVMGTLSDLRLEDGGGLKSKALPCRSLK